MPLSYIICPPCKIDRAQSDAYFQGQVAAKLQDHKLLYYIYKLLAPLKFK